MLATREAAAATSRSAYHRACITTRGDNDMNDLQYLLASGALLFVQVMAASLMRARAWTPAGLFLAFGNRSGMPEPSPAAARADRAARNMIENLLLVLCAIAAARLSGASSADVTPGAAMFFWSRVAYMLLYIGGVTFLRTAAWAVGVTGIVMIAMLAF